MAGVTAIETSAAAETVRFVEPETLPEVAVAVVLPSDTLLASPEILMVAMPAPAVLHATDAVISSVLPSV